MGHKPLWYSSCRIYLLKRKNQFLKGRTIISYSNSCIKELLKAASHAILLMIRLVWPEAMGLATTPQLWKASCSSHHPPSRGERRSGGFFQFGTQAGDPGLSVSSDRTLSAQRISTTHFNLSSKATQLRVSLAWKATGQRCQAHSVSACL